MRKRRFAASSSSTLGSLLASTRRRCRERRKAIVGIRLVDERLSGGLVDDRAHRVLIAGVEDKRVLFQIEPFGLNELLKLLPLCGKGLFRELKFRCESSYEVGRGCLQFSHGRRVSKYLEVSSGGFGPKKEGPPRALNYTSTALSWGTNRGAHQTALSRPRAAPK